MRELVLDVGRIGESHEYFNVHQRIYAFAIP